jgi:outer membrane lipoprotein-sorting protein
MKPEENIKMFIKNAGLSINQDTHERVFRDMLDSRKQVEADSSADLQPRYWRIIMANKITKLAATAAIIVAVMLAANIFIRPQSPAWAIEQSIQALSKYKAVFMEGLESLRIWSENVSPELRPAKSWAVANNEQTKIEKYRTEIDGLLIIITNGRKTWLYDPNTNTVKVNNFPYVYSDFWISQFLEQLKEARDSGEWEIKDWKITYGKDPVSGKRVVFLTFALLKGSPWPRSLWFEFDAQTKLPIRFKQWENPNWEGSPSQDIEKITYYETLPDDLFEFKIPEGAKIIESN